MKGRVERRMDLDFRSWEELKGEVDRLHRTGYERAGNWSLAEALDHLGAGLRAAVTDFPHRMPWIVRKIARGFVFPGIIRRRRMTPGLKVPSWWLPAQRTNWDDGEAVAKFHREIDTFLQHVGPTHDHPIFGKLDAKEWEELILIHSAHHLSFLVPRE
jgi:hypothetical protein